ncbi:hypothetical protein HNR11_000451 [Nesterenkonia sandarakina]|uniref:Uncharacterized protein n=1 Tax=Nesterenkonia sandarakina TaxID=272918 RepID=A0A7Z0E7S7_9MICC|nr:hypothetical protein [Nesterenkonia sandarakina]
MKAAQGKRKPLGRKTRGLSLAPNGKAGGE